MAENSSFRPGGGNNTQNKPTKADSERRDEYNGGYKERANEYNETAKFGTDQLPVQNDPLPAKGLKNVGG